jgi:2-(1,2-epoxy-1,2-dihydrophenyl)acetyl-CoA isomerase
MSDDSLLFEREGGVATLTLNRPDKGNAIDPPLARALLDAAITCSSDPTIRCVVLTGAGRMFCAGGDVALFASAGDRMPALVEELTGYLHAATSRLMRMDKPLVTAINGAAAGAGLGLALLGDIALAARSAKFTMAYTAIGLSPDGGSTWFLPRLIGLRRAQELALTNRRLSADEAVSLGLVTHAIDDGALGHEAAVIAAQLATSATRALGRTRNLLLSSSETSLEEQMALEAKAILASSRDSESDDGIAAFLAKRKPVFGP